MKNDLFTPKAIQVKFLDNREELFSQDAYLLVKDTLALHRATKVTVEDFTKVIMTTDIVERE